MECLSCAFFYFTYSRPWVSRKAFLSVFTAIAKRSLLRWKQRKAHELIWRYLVTYDVLLII